MCMPVRSFLLISRQIDDIQRSVFLIYFFFFSLGFAGKLNAKFTEADHIHIREHDRSMGLAATKRFGSAPVQGGLRIIAALMESAIRDLVNVKTWVFASEVFGFNCWIGRMASGEITCSSHGHSGQLFQGVQKKSCRCTEKIRSFSTYDASVRKFQ